MKVFALRMVRATTSPRWRGPLRKLVAGFLERLSWNGDFPNIIDWDHSTDYDYVDSHTWADGKTSHWRRKGTHAYLCDEVTRYIWDMEDEGKLPRRSGFDDPDKESRMANHLQCCIRAACDVAASPSAGVCGYRMRHLREMWRGRKLPKWVVSYLGCDVTQLDDETHVWL